MASSGRIRHSLLRFDRILLVLLLLSTSSCTPNQPASPIPPAIMAAILKYFTDDIKRLVLRQRSLTPEERVDLGDTIDHHKGFFVQTRAQWLVNTHSDWINEPNQTHLRQQLVSDLDEVERYIGTKLGTASSPGPLAGATEPGSPAGNPKDQEYVAPPRHHLDLTDVAFTRTNTSTKEANGRRSALVRDRVRRVHGIVWRAAGLHADLWGSNGKLVDAAMDEILDRRLRTVERMATQVTSRPALGVGGMIIRGPADTGTAPVSDIVPPSAPWEDLARVRPFEYPRFAESLASLATAIGVQNILPKGSLGFQANKPWLRENSRKGRLLYNVPPAPGLHFSATTRSNWTQESSSPYTVTLTPSGASTAASAVDDIFKGRFDWWNRAWMFCDHVVSALHIEALLFGLRRRPPKTDDLFNSLSSGGYVQLDAHISGSNGKLMSDPNDHYFDNLNIDERLLEIGDQVLFWNSKLYSYLIRNEWRLENAIVADIESDGREGRVVRKAIKLLGHGIEARRYDVYQHKLTGELEGLFGEVRKATESESANFTWNPTGATIVKWDPFERFSSPGAWWIALNDGTGITRAIAQGDVVGSPAQPYPSQFAALFPLYEPRIAVATGEQPWKKYLGDPSLHDSAPRKLANVKATVAEIPGFFVGGEGRPIACIRAKVRL